MRGSLNIRHIAYRVRDWGDLRDLALALRLCARLLALKLARSILFQLLDRLLLVARWDRGLGG
jgi:hypothetical protein